MTQGAKSFSVPMSDTAIKYCFQLTDDKTYILLQRPKEKKESVVIVVFQEFQVNPTLNK